jgi:D-alanyl-D-alanine carboxypeptidase
MSKKSEILAELQSALQAGIEAGSPGVSATISSSKGTLWSSTAGVFDLSSGQSLETTHLLGIGSITKVFVTVVILQLIESNHLKLSSTVADILDSKTTEGIHNASMATVESLLRHTSGIESWEDDPIWIKDGRGKDLDPNKTWHKSETLNYIRRAHPNPSGPKPGTYSYSNTNFTLLGLIIETLTHNTAESEIRSRILSPLGMKNTYLERFEPPHHPERVSKRHHWATPTFRSTAGICPSFPLLRENLLDASSSNLSVEWVAGGMLSTPSDLAAFFLALRDGGLLSPSSLAIVKDWMPAESGLEVGHGLFRFEGPRWHGKWIGHFGSVLGFTGALLWVEEGDCVVCVLANVGTMHCGEVPSSAVSVVAGSEFLRLAVELGACGE